ncbi:MAG: hypothetical protein R3350_00720 [Saprospiraceae bacterium]|nr:hypothetical protein [Saprospiraceae bacterium]
MDIKDQYLQLQKELEKYKPTLAKASDVILDQGVSSYPIFVLSKKPVAIGVALVSMDPEQSGWNIYASTLEELATKKVVEMEKVEEFKQVYKDPSEFFCLFVLSDLGANFAFLPRG